MKRLPLRSGTIRLAGAFGLIVLITLLLALAGPAHAQDATGGDAEHGAELYAQNCQVCHGAHGEGRIGATLDKVFATIAPDVYITTTITNGRQGTYMPAWGQANGGPLSDQDIADLVAYIESWGTTVEPPLPAPSPPQQIIPPVPEVNGDPNNGYKIFQTNCVACHGANGEGRIGADLSAPFIGISPSAIVVTTISNGREGTLMPPFAQNNGGPLTGEEVNDVAAYVLSIEGTQAQPQQTGETVQKVSAGPLLAVLGIIVLVIVALGVAVSGREKKEEEAAGSGGEG